MATTSLSALEGVRERFPALRRAGERTIFFDNAAGAQVPDEVHDAIRRHLLERNVQRGGHYPLSREVDEQIAETRRLLAAFVNAGRPEEIVFGLNATTLIRAVAEMVRAQVRPGDRIVVTEFDHEANIGPWLRLESSGASPVFWSIRRPDARLHLEDLGALLKQGQGGRVLMVALPLASNATGGILDVGAAARLAREAGAMVFVDAVHYAPHGPIDAQALGADFLVFSGYKIFGPHIGFLWGRSSSLRSLRPPREFFIPPEAPNAFEAGTQNYEGIAGMAGAVRYLASLAGKEAGDERDHLRRAMGRIREYEKGLSSALLSELARVPGLEILGEGDPGRAEERVPTVAFRIANREPRQIVELLAARGIHAREGHMYTPRLLAASGIDALGVTRVSLCHYNTRDEIERFAGELRSLV